MLMNLLKLAGAVALLVWGLYMIKTGILRTFGENLRSWLAERLRTRFAGFAAGFGLAALLQSSTASALLVAGLQKKGLVTTAIALSCVLGADLGSAFVVRILAFDLSAAVPALLIAGVFLFTRRPETRRGQFGRILLGLAFVMLSLRMIVGATEPFKTSEAMSAAFALINASAPLSALLGALLALFCFSSLAVVAVASSAAAGGLFTPEAGLWVVLGANFGSALLAFLSTLRSSRVVRRAPTGNLFFRTAGFAVAAAILALFPAVDDAFAARPDGLIVFHLAFNALLGAAGLCFIGPVAALIERLLPERSTFPDTEVRIFSEENLLSSATALRLAEQEIEKTSGFLCAAWAKLALPLRANPPAGVLLAMHDEAEMILRRCRAVERFLDVLLRMGLPAGEVRLWQSLNTANDGLSYAAEVVESMIDALGAKKCADGCSFTPEGLAELLAQHRAIGEELQRLREVFSEPRARRRRCRRALKSSIRRRDAETFALLSKHMTRVAKGEAGAIDTSALHVDLLSLFRRVESAVAFAVGDID